jgi:hypothetical protein
VNFAHKLLLLKAEFESLTEVDEKKVRRMYDSTISAAARGGFINDAAIGNERAGSWFAGRNDQFWAQTYIERAYALYKDWSAHGKARDLMKQFPTILGSEDSSFIEGVDYINYETRSHTTTPSESCMPSTMLTSVPMEATRLNSPLKMSSTAFRGVKRFDPSVSDQHLRISSGSTAVLSSDTDNG